MKMSEYYDSKLYLYQGLIDLPLQVLMLDIYDKIGHKQLESYLAMAALGLGSSLLSEKLGKGVYHTLHPTSVNTPQQGTRYYSDLRTKYFYDYTVSSIAKEVPKKQDILQEQALEILKQAPTYSENYTKLWWGIWAASTTYKTLSAQKNNVLYDILYGLTQPLSVALKDNGTLK